MRDYDNLIGEYIHLKHLPREAEALHILRKIASCVKPIMRRRGWRIGVLCEFLPDQSNLLGLNINHGAQINVRLRPNSDVRQFIRFDSVLDTLLHELAHNAIGPHNADFHKLWDELRDEWYTLQIRGFTGEGFLGKGELVGGRSVPRDEVRRLSRSAALQREKERQSRASRQGRPLGGGTTSMPVSDPRQEAAEAAIQRNAVTEGCANGTKAGVRAAEDAVLNGFRTKEDMDEADRFAIELAMAELASLEDWRNSSEADENAPHSSSSLPLEGLTWSRENGLQPAPPSNPPSKSPTPIPQELNRHGRPISRLIVESSKRASSTSSLPAPEARSGRSSANSFEPNKYQEYGNGNLQCIRCTLINEAGSVNCDACDLPLPVPNTSGGDNSVHVPGRSSAPPPLPMTSKPIGWLCTQCGTFMESTWWTCSSCGMMKLSS